MVEQTRPWYAAAAKEAKRLDRLPRKIQLDADPPDEKRVRQKIEGFRKLRPGWDSHHGSVPVSEPAIQRALEIIALLARRNAPIPEASATPDGGICLVWEVGEHELELLIDERSFDYNVARRGHPKVLNQGSLKAVQDVESGFIQRFLLQPA